MELQNKIKGVVREIPDFPREGILFRDITPVFQDQQLCSAIVDGFAERMSVKPDAIAGVESRGFLFGILLANKLGIPFVIIRKAGKLPFSTYSEDYLLEYGSSKLELHTDAVKAGWKVMIHDDLLATGGTAEASARLIKRGGAEVAGFNFLVSLDHLKGKDKLIKHTNNITCLVHY